MEIQNTGLGDAKNVSVRFLQSPGISVGSVSNFFIGSLAAGSSQTVSLFISANQSGYQSNYSIPARIR